MGAAVSLISQETKEKLLPSVLLGKSSLKFHTYISDSIAVLGQMEVEVRYGGHTSHHKLYVVRGRGPPLLGRDWVQHLRLDWASIHFMFIEGNHTGVEEVTSKYAEVFQEELGTMKGIRVHLNLREGATPCFCRPHPVPFAIKEVVGRKLD